MAHLITGYAGYEHIKSEDDGAFNAAFFGDGQFVMESGKKFQGSVLDNNTVRILDGDLLMYGRHVRIAPNTYEDVTIETGTAGRNRIDIIAMTYEKSATDTTEKAYLQVIKGTETAGTASAPKYTNGNILNGATLNQMPLYKVAVEGVVLKSITPMFTVCPTYKELAEKYEKEFMASCENHLNSLGVLDTMAMVQANTQENQLAGALALKESHSSKAPTSHTSTGTTYGVGSTTQYGHCMTVDSLTNSAYEKGKALSAHQGYVLNGKITSANNNIDLLKQHQLNDTTRMDSLEDDISARAIKTYARPAAFGATNDDDLLTMMQRMPMGSTVSFWLNKDSTNYANIYNEILAETTRLGLTHAYGTVTITRISNEWTVKWEAYSITGAIIRRYSTTNSKGWSPWEVLYSHDIHNKKRRRYIFCGDSYGVGYTPDGDVTPWVTKVAGFLKIADGDWFNACWGGASFGGEYKFLTKLQEMSETITDHNTITDIVMVGGYNDKEQTVDNIAAGINAFFSYCRSEYPNAKCHLGFVGYNTMDALSVNILRAKNQYCISAGLNGVAYIGGLETAVHGYSYMSSDGYHPKESGQYRIAYGVSVHLSGGVPNLGQDVANIGISFSNGWKNNLSNSPMYQSMTNWMKELTMNAHSFGNSGISNFIADGTTAYEIGTLSSGCITGNNSNATFFQTFGNIKVDGKLYDAAITYRIAGRKLYAVIFAGTDTGFVSGTLTTINGAASKHTFSILPN